MKYYTLFEIDETETEIVCQFRIIDGEFEMDSVNRVSDMTPFDELLDSKELQDECLEYAADLAAERGEC